MRRKSFTFVPFLGFFVLNRDMNTKTYRALLDEQVGFTPGVVFSPSQVAAYNPSLVQDPAKNHVAPFGSLILPFHEVLFSTPDRVHEFVESHFTRRLRDLTAQRPLYVKSCPVSGWVVLAQLSRKGLIVDLPVRLRVQRLVINFPSHLRYTSNPHLLNKRWYFYSLALDHRQAVSRYIEHEYQPTPDHGPMIRDDAKAPSRLWPKG